MSAPAFTPGPWSQMRHWAFSGFLVFETSKPDEELPGVAIVTDHPLTGERREANARLIAASPEMFETLQAALDFINCEFACPQSAAEDGDPIDANARPIRDALVAVLAKAEGRE